MSAKRKAASPFQVGTLGKTASINKPKHTLKLPQNQQTTKAKSPLHLTRIWIASLFVRMACWEMLLAALAVFLWGGLVHA
jgi:hypothetical protein